MEELILIEKEPNVLEEAIIEWDIPSLKKLLLDRNLLYSLGYSSAEVDHMHIMYFGIRIPNPDQMTNFENAVYRNDKKTVITYYNYMAKSISAMESFGYTEDDLKNIRFVHIGNNKRFAAEAIDSYVIANRLHIMQKNKNKMAERYFVKYLKETPEPLHKAEAINSLVKIYKEEDYIPERLADFERLVAVYPDMLEYSQLNRSFYIELLYRNSNNPNRYQEICRLGDYYEEQLQRCKNRESEENLTAAEKEQIKIEKRKYILEEKAKYLYAISLFKTHKNGWKYFVKNKLYELTNVAYMKDILEASGDFLKIYIENNLQEDGIYYSDILHKMAEKAGDKRGNANYGFLLYLNRQFGPEYGIDWDGLVEKYQNADRERNPFEYNGYGTYLYALAEEYKRINNSLEGFPYRLDLDNLRRTFYGYFVKNIEIQLLSGSVACETIRYKIGLLNHSIKTGEKKLLGNNKKNDVNALPRYLFFFPEQDQNLYDKYNEAIQNDIKQARERNTDKNMLKNLKLSVLANQEAYDDNNDELVTEVSFYIWKKIQLCFDESKDQWLVLAKIYEYYMNKYKQLSNNELTEEKRQEYQSLYTAYSNKLVNALRIRAELAFVYDDWYDLYQHYYWQAKRAAYNERMQWIKPAYELYLEIAYKVRNDADQAGKHFNGLQAYFTEERNNLFGICIKTEKGIAAKYIEELARLYYKYHHYRYLRFAFDITKVTKEFTLYLKNFLQALVQWEVIQLIRSIHYLLKIGDYEKAQEFYDNSVEHINNIPAVLKFTQELINELKATGRPYNNNIFDLLINYPNISNEYEVKNSNERAMQKNIKALNFIIDYYTNTEELTGEQDCSPIYYALYLQYKNLYSVTLNDEYLIKMKETLAAAGEEKGYLPYLYKVVTLCYRYEHLNQYSASIIEEMNISPGIAGKLEEYKRLLDSIKVSLSNEQDKVFEELCDLTLNYTRDTKQKTVSDIKEFITKYILSDKYEMTAELIEYLMSFDMIDRIWLQLYFEQDHERSQLQTLADYARGFYPVNKVLYLLESSNDDEKDLFNPELLKACAYSGEGSDRQGMESPYVMLVSDYLNNNSSNGFIGAELLHHLFESLEKDKGPALYDVIDTINEASQYNNSQCILLFEQLYRETNDYSYLTGLARQHAKARNYIEAEACYRKLLARVEDNPVMEKRYAYVKNHKYAIAILVKANNNEKIKISELEDITAKQLCEVFAYLSDKYSEEVPKVSELLLDEAERQLLEYIYQLINFEELVSDMRYKKNKATDAYEEAQERVLFKKLLSLKGTVYFNLLLPNLYQRSRSSDFKYYLESIKDNNIQAILREANNKPILTFIGQRMPYGQKLIFMDYERQEKNVDININSLENMQETHLLQEIINNHKNKQVTSIKDLLLQLDRENYNLNHRRNILLNILSFQPDDPVEFENDTQLQKRLQLAKAELGYLMHLEKYDKSEEESLDLLHEGIICVENDKSYYRMLLEKIRDRYLMILEAVPKKTLHEASKQFVIMISDIKKITQVLDNDNNDSNVFLKDMLFIITRLQIYERLNKQSNSIEILETVMVKLASIRSESKLIKNITRLWSSWLHSELIRTVDRDTIRDIKYFIDRKESKASLNDIYQMVLNHPDSVNIFGPKGVGVSSVLWQCYQLYNKEAILKRTISFYVDIKEISGYYEKEDRFGFSRRLSELIRQGIAKLSDSGFNMDADVLEDIEQVDGLLNCFKIIKRVKDINRIHVFLDHYDELEEDARKKMDLLLYYLDMEGIKFVLGSEAAIKVKSVDFKAFELTGFSEKETGAYIYNRLQYNRVLLKADPLPKIHRLTGGMPALLSITVEYMLENKRFSEDDVRTYLISKAGLLFESWNGLWKEKLNREGNEAYRRYLGIKEGQTSEELINKVGELEQKLNDNTLMLNEANSKLKAMETKFNFISKKLYAENNHITGNINLEEYHKVHKWTQQREVNPADYGVTEEIWDVIKSDYDIYRYIKFGEALKQELFTLSEEERISDYDYSVFALNYCLAFEWLCHKMLKSFLIEKIPDYKTDKIKPEIPTLKDSKKDTKYSLGQYARFVKFFSNRYKKVLTETGLKIEQIVDDMFTAASIRNDVAHANLTFKEEQFHKFVFLLFGDKTSRGKRTPIFEGICRIIKLSC